MANASIGAAVLAVMTVLAAGAACAQGLPGDAGAGRELALSHCASCHAIARLPLWPPLSRARSFADIARSPETTELGLRAFLQTPHARMPNLVLSRPQTDDVISYILSLRSR